MSGWRERIKQERQERSDPQRMIDNRRDMYAKRDAMLKRKLGRDPYEVIREEAQMRREAKR